MKKIIILLLTVSMASCMSFQQITDGVPQSTIDSIPKGATKIIVVNSETMQANYSDSYHALLSQDFKIQQSNKEMGYLLATNTAPGDTQVRLNIVCKAGTIIIHTEWTAGTQTGMFMGHVSAHFSWYPAKWAKTETKSTSAFVSAVKVASELKGTLRYD